VSDTPAKAVIPLAVTDHRRDILGFQYVYPVVSRRAGGVSVGINLNPNNACNWRCVYCQVPDLTRGNAPEIDLALLEEELDALLNDIVHGDFMARNVPDEARRLNDIAFSGNGEPTASRQFAEAIDLAARMMGKYGLLGQIKLVLITNGSQLYKPAVQAAVARMRELNGEVWFKFDRAPVDGYSEVNQIALSVDQVKRHLAAATARCTTWVQTCMFATDGKPPADWEVDAYLEVLADAMRADTKPTGVLLYGLARPSTQPEAHRLTRAPEAWMQALAARIEALGLAVKLSL
jgi:wyosine [tRNA(Phe)-imidazoG37] synthetase (radical SAM superfamily)